MRTSLPAPTLDELATRPELAARLAPATRSALLARVAAVLAALSAVPAEAAAREEPDRVLDVEEAARRLDVSRGHVYRNAAEWPFTVRRGRKLGFSAAGIAEWLADQRRVRGARTAAISPAMLDHP